MARKSKRRKQIEKQIDSSKVYSLEEAVSLLKSAPSLKFDESIDFSLKLGVDPKKSDQQVRSTVALPHGSGKTVKILVFAKGDKVKEALDAGAEYAGPEEYVEKVKSGWVDFNVVVATPDMMREVGRLGKVLGPRGLMPSPKAGTVTNNVAKAVKELKGGKIEFKLDKQANVNGMLGKLSFKKEDLIENIKTFLSAVLKARPASSKGSYIKSFYLSSTMGPGLQIETHSIT